MDERDEEDIACEVESLPFVMNRDLAYIYGSSFRVAVEHGKGAALTVIREKG